MIRGVLERNEPGKYGRKKNADASATEQSRQQRRPVVHAVKHHSTSCTDTDVSAQSAEKSTRGWNEKRKRTVRPGPKIQKKMQTIFFKKMTRTEPLKTNNTTIRDTVRESPCCIFHTEGAISRIP
jgi:hypothetical protein